MLKKIITRPVLATVISIILVLLGLVSMQRIPVTMFPDIAPPTVTVSGSYPGGNSESVIRSVITPLEEAINGVENMQYISSSAGSDGAFSLRIVFKQGVNPDQASVNVQNRVAQVNSLIPAEVIRAGITTTRQQNSNIMFFNISSKDKAKYDELFLQNYAKINLITSLKRIPGIGNVQLFGSKDYAMRIWLDPQKMTVNSIVPQDIDNAIANSSLEASPGKLGEESDAPMQYTIKYKGKLNTAEAFEKIVIKASPDGAMLRLKDVARIEFGASFYGSDNKENGFPAVTIGIQQASGSNANEIETAVRAQLETFSKRFPKGVEYHIIQSVKERLDQSIKQVRNTFIEAFILVFIVVFLFLQDFRSTLIPAIAVPVAIIGTFFFLQLLGFTMNVLTLFALVLAIGIVVDDAIVVVEAVHAKMQKTGLPAKEATIATMGEITSAIVSITLVMSAVFLPIGFMDGPAGIFYKQFAFTLAIAILISALNALTLSPALCALLLKNTHQHNSEKEVNQNFKQRFFTAFNAGFDTMTGRYIQSVKWLIKKKWLALAGLCLVTILSVWMMNRSPKSFIPEEDDRFVTYSLALKSGTNIDYTTKVIERIDRAFEKMPEVELVTSVSGFDIISGSSGPSYGIGFIRLKESKKRGEIKDMNQLVTAMNERLSTIKEGELSIFRSPPVEGFGSISGAELVLQDKMSGNIDDFAKVTQNLVAELNKSPEIGSAFTMFRNDFPQLEMELDEDKTYQLGTTPKDVMNTLGLFYGGSQASDFIRFGRFYRVNIKAEGQYRTDENSLSQVFVKSNTGKMIPVSTLVTLKKVYGPELINRYNLYNSISVNIIPAAGFSNSQAMAVAEEMMKTKLPASYGYEWTGLSKEEKDSGSQMIFVFSLCVLFTYFLLAAQYESYLLPLAVIFSIPTGLLGVYLAIGLAGLTNSIYVQVGLIMLIGLLAKNAILIVEFALQARKSGMSLVRSALSGSRYRLRPILMTSIAFIAGITPLMFASGSSAIGNKSISISTAGGMVSGVLLGLFIIPVLFVLFQSLQEYFSPGRKPTSNFNDEINKISAMKPYKSSLSILFVMLMLVSCSVTKDYTKPDLSTPAQFVSAENSGNDTTVLNRRDFFKNEKLVKLIDHAVEKNSEIQLAIQNIESAGAVFKKVKLNYLPELNAQVNANRNTASKNSLAGISAQQFTSSTTTQDFTASLGLTWEIDIWGKIKRQKEVALADYLQSQAVKKAVQTRLVADVANGYYNLLMLDKQLLVAKRNIELGENTLQVLRIQFKYGDANALGIQQATAQLEQVKALQSQIGQAIEQQEIALGILCGNYPSAIEREERINNELNTTHMDYGISVLANRPDVSASEFSLRSANAKAGVAQASLYPAISLSLQAGLNSLKVSNWFAVPASLFSTFAGGVTQPVFNRGTLKLQQKQAKIDYEKAVINFRQSVLAAYGEVSIALIKEEKLKEQAMHIRLREQELEKGIVTAKKLFKNGMVNYLEVITAENNYLEASLASAQLQKEQIANKIELYRAVGGGWN